MNKQLRDYMRKLGKKGGKSRVANMTAAERSASARAAVKARWAKRQEAK